MTRPASGTHDVAPGAEGSARRAVERRLPGRARPGEEVVREYQEFNAKLRERITPVLWVFFAPNPDGLYRWRVALDCGCITEVMTWGGDRLPADQQSGRVRHAGGERRSALERPVPAVPAPAALLLRAAPARRRRPARRPPTRRVDHRPALDPPGRTAGGSGRVHPADAGRNHHRVPARRLPDPRRPRRSPLLSASRTRRRQR